MIARLLCLGLCGLLLTGWSGAVLAQSPRLEVIPDSRSLELGEPLGVTLRAQHSAGDLFALSLQELAADFQVRWEQRSRGRRGVDRVWARQEMRLRLYPRRTGTLTLPALYLRDAGSAPVTIQVREPERLGLGMGAGVDTPSPYLREPVLLWLEIETDHDQFEVRAPDLRFREAHVEALGRTRERSGDGRYRLRYQWLITPLYSGDLELVLPWLEIHDYQRQGIPLRYPAPTVQMAVREAPGYLPVDLPLAPVTVRQWLVGDGPRTRGEPLRWVLEVQGRDVSPRALRRLLDRGLANSPGLRLHAPVIRREEVGGLPAGERLLRVEVPVTPLSAGEQVLPGLRVPYFDTATGRLAVKELPGLRYTVQDPVGEVLKGLLTGLLALLLAALVLLPVLVGVRRLRARRRLFAALAEARDGATLARALLSVEGSPPTLGQWLAVQRAGPGLRVAVQTLEAARYGGAASDIGALRARLLTALGGHRLRLPPMRLRFVNRAR
ncbi:MAG TPA: BatD family protein [Thioalkalivibrio sp.]|nr:BatD family protein [Thioalkalivibrio sp.]